MRQILDDALKIADRCSNPEDRDAIYKAVSDINAMMDALCELRAQGKVSEQSSSSFLLKEMFQHFTNQIVLWLFKTETIINYNIYCS